MRSASAVIHRTSKRARPIPADQDRRVQQDPGDAGCVDDLRQPGAGRSRSSPSASDSAGASGSRSASRRSCRRRTRPRPRRRPPGPAVLLGRDQRAEHVPGSETDEHRDASTRPGWPTATSARAPRASRRAAPSRQSVHLAASSASPPTSRRRGRRRTTDRGADEERRRIDRERGPGAGAQHEQGRQRRADELAHVVGHRRQRVGLLDLVLGDRLRQQRGPPPAGRRLPRSRTGPRSRPGARSRRRP